MGGSRALVVTLLVVVPLVALTGAPAQAQAPCAQPVDIPGQGLSCPAPEGWRVLLGNGEWVLTHGPDARPTASLGTSAAPSDPRCIADGDTGIVLIYANPSDRSSRYATVLATIRSTMREMNGRLNEAAAETGGSANYRVVCDVGQTRVANMQLSTSSTADSFSTIVTELQNRGYTSTASKYLVFYDDGVANYCGQGTLAGDDRLAADNANNRGPSYGIVYDAFGGCAGSGVPMHENGHNMGAVQNSAPRSSLAGHCNDGQDVMCYADGGSAQCTTGGGNCRNTCFDYDHFDCGHDTYFHTNPPAGSYLATRWNIGLEVNSFLDLGSSCVTTAIVILYENSNFLGGCKAFNADDLDLGNDFLDNNAWANDATSSILVRQGYRVTLYQHANFAGTAKSFTGAVTFVGNDFNDVASSLHIDPCDASATVVLYQDINYAGGCKTFTASDADFTNDRFSNNGIVNDGTTSLRVKAGSIATLYADINYGGESRDLTGDVSLLGNGWNDRASSLALASVGAPCASTSYTIAYQDINYGGACKALNADHPDLALNLFSNAASVNDQLTSMKVRYPFRVTLYSEPNYTGSALTLTADSAYVGNSWNDRVSSVRVACQLPLTLPYCALVPDL